MESPVNENFPLSCNRLYGKAIPFVPSFRTNPIYRFPLSQKAAIN